MSTRHEGLAMQSGVGDRTLREEKWRENSTWVLRTAPVRRTLVGGCWEVTPGHDEAGVGLRKSLYPKSGKSVVRSARAASAVVAGLASLTTIQPWFQYKSVVSHGHNCSCLWDSWERLTTHTLTWNIVWDINSNDCPVGALTLPWASCFCTPLDVLVGPGGLAPPAHAATAGAPSYSVPNNHFQTRAACW